MEARSYQSFLSEKAELKKLAGARLAEDLHPEQSHDVNVIGQGCLGVEEDLEAAFSRLIANDKSIDLSKDFLGVKNAIEKGEVFKVLRAMPKGALLHTHGIATGPFEDLAMILREREAVFVSRSDSENEQAGVIRFLSGNVDRKQYQDAKHLGLKDILKLLELPPDTQRTERWSVFQSIWNRVGKMSETLDLWYGEDSYLWCMLKRLLDSGIVYVEFRKLISEVWIMFSNESKALEERIPCEMFMNVFATTVRLFKEKYPQFLGAKMLWSSLKIDSPAKVASDCNVVLELSKNYGEYIAGFDLVGQEDTTKPISEYSEVLLDFKNKGGKLILHAGETRDPNADQLFDAIALGTLRIGHGFDLINYPPLMKIVKERNIALECCPISNQVLGYFNDLREHPGGKLFRYGIPITINSDDAGMFRYGDVTFDFAVAAKAWNLSLSELHRIALTSLEHSRLDAAQREKGIVQFEEAWGSFLIYFRKYAMEAGLLE